VSVSKAELLQALSYDFSFRGPSIAQNKDMLTQQAMQWFSTFGAILPQHRQLAYAAQTYDIRDLKGRGQVLPDSDIQAALEATMQPPPAPPAVGPDGQPLPPQEAPPPGAEMAPPAAA
jgi:hypothetical protein